MKKTFILPLSLSSLAVASAQETTQTKTLEWTDAGPVVEFTLGSFTHISEDLPTGGIYLVTVTHSGGLAGNPAPTTQEVSVVSSNAAPLMATIDSIEVSPTQDEFILTYTSDPGAYYIVESSTSLEATSWTNEGTTLAEDSSNTIIVTTQSGDPRRFWRLKRSQQ